MIRDVDLVSYLPPFLAEYKEIDVTLEAENPEFRLIWEAADKVLYNEFIATADEYGISRFERILGILPSSDDTLESRRARVQSRWLNAVPHTWRVFLGRLISLCGEGNFTVTTDLLHYQIELEVSLAPFGKVEELEHMIETMIPCNIVCVSTNKIPCRAEGAAMTVGGTCAVETFFISNDFHEQYDIAGSNNVGSGVSVMQFIEANNLEE